MALNVALSTLVTRAQQIVPDGEGDDSVLTAEWKMHLAMAYRVFHGMVRIARYFETEATISATGASGYAVPSDHLETITVDFLYTGNTRRALTLITAVERTRFSGVTGDAYWYAIEGSNIVLYPTPSTGTYKHLYIPQPTDYSSSSDSTSVDVIFAEGERFILYSAAVAYMNKRESQADALVRERELARGEVQAWATERILQHQRRPETFDESSYAYDPYGYPPPWGWR